MVRRTVTVDVELPDPGRSVAVAKAVIKWLSLPENQPYHSIEQRPFSPRPGQQQPPTPTTPTGAGNASPVRRRRLIIKDRIPTLACCGVPLFYRDMELDASLSPDPRAPRLVLVCTSPMFQTYTTTWQVIEETRFDGKPYLVVRGDVVLEPKWWSLSSALAVRHVLSFQEELLRRMKRSVEGAESLHGPIAVVAEGAEDEEFEYGASALARGS